MRRGERLRAVAIALGAILGPLVVLVVSLGSIVQPFDASKAVAAISGSAGTLLDLLGWGRYASTALLSIPIFLTRE